MGETDPTVVTEIWLFLGSRVSSKGTRMHGWAVSDEPDHEMFFKAKGSYSVGCTYKVRVSRGADDRVTMHGTGVYAEPHPDKDLRASISARHHAAEVTLTRLAMERSQNRIDPLDEALAPLVEIARTVPASQRDAFTLYVMRRLFRVW